MNGFSIIVACDNEWGIGNKGTIPWTLKRDLNYFKQVTTTTTGEQGKRNAVIMGSKTFLSIPERFRPLSNRLNIVLTRSSQLKEGKDLLIATGLDEALCLARQDKTVEKIFIIGGSSVYGEALVHPQCERIYLTRIYQTFECDTFFPSLANCPDGYKTDIESVSEQEKEGSISFQFFVFKRVAISIEQKTESENVCISSV